MIRFAGLYPTDDALQRSREHLEQFVCFLEFELASKVHIVFQEAMANAIQANKRNNGARIIVIFSLGPSGVRLLVGDNGCGFEPMPLQNTVFDLWAERGRGIQLMRELADSLTYKKTKKGTMLSAHWQYPLSTMRR